MAALVDFLSQTYKIHPTGFQRPCHSKGQPMVERQRDSLGCGTAAGIWLHLG